MFVNPLVDQFLLYGCEHVIAEVVQIKSRGQFIKDEKDEDRHDVGEDLGLHVGLRRHGNLHLKHHGYPHQQRKACYCAAEIRYLKWEIYDYVRRREVIGPEESLLTKLNGLGQELPQRDNHRILK